MVEVVLPTGFERDGAWQCRLWVRPWCGHDEASLAEAGSRPSPAARTTEFLTRCLTLDGEVPVTPALVRGLTVGDREALLLHLRRATLGERLACVLTCPACGEPMDLDLQVSDLLVPPYGYERRDHTAHIVDGEESFEVRFRLPTGGDQEIAAALVLVDPARAERLVLERCVLEVIAADGNAGFPLPPAVARELPRLMAQLDPQAELRLDAGCPACAAPFTVIFDTGRYLEQEILDRRGDLFREVHVLASHYHWSEAEILALTGSRRQRYLALVAETRGTERAR